MHTIARQAKLAMIRYIHSISPGATITGNQAALLSTRRQIVPRSRATSARDVGAAAETLAAPNTQRDADPAGSMLSQRHVPRTCLDLHVLI